MKKKISLASLILACVLIATGCGQDNDATKNEDPKSNLEQDKSTGDKGKGENKAPVYTFKVDDILDKIKAVYGEAYLPNMVMDEEMVKMTFNIDLSLIEEYVAEMPMISVNPDKVLIVKAKEGKIKEVVAQLDATRKDVIENGFTYPMSMEKLQATKVVSKGDFAAFLMVGSAENLSEDPAERIKFAESEVQKAVNAFNSMFQ